MPLPEIRAILAGDPDRTKALLRGHRERLAELADRQRYAITLLDSMLREEIAMTYEVHLRETSPQLAAAVRGRAAWSELGPFIQAALIEVFGVARSQGARFAGPAYGIYHGAEATEAEVDLEIGMPVAEPIEPAGRVIAAVISAGSWQLPSTAGATKTSLPDIAPGRVGPGTRPRNRRPAPRDLRRGARPGAGSGRSPNGDRLADPMTAPA